MKIQYVGQKALDFLNDKGERIKGTNLYFLQEDDNTVGLKSGHIFLREGITLPKDAQINDVLEIYCDLKGKVERIIKV